MSPLIIAAKVLLMVAGAVFFVGRLDEISGTNRTDFWDWLVFFIGLACLGVGAFL